MSDLKEITINFTFKYDKNKDQYKYDVKFSSEPKQGVVYNISDSLLLLHKCTEFTYEEFYEKNIIQIIIPKLMQNQISSFFHHKLETKYSINPKLSPDFYPYEFKKSINENKYVEINMYHNNRSFREYNNIFVSLNMVLKPTQKNIILIKMAYIDFLSIK
jgi:hypothetical protein